jgi:dCMP deaminase
MTITRPQQEWDKFFLGLAKYYSGQSKDPSTKVGAVIVRPNKTVAGLGYNGFPTLMPDHQHFLNDRSKKYPRMVHAEINALGTVLDHNLTGFTCYSTFMPCDRCLVQLSSRYVMSFRFPKPTADELTRWGESFKLTKELAADMNIQLVEFDVI